MATNLNRGSTRLSLAFFVAWLGLFRSNTINPLEFLYEWFTLQIILRTNPGLRIRYQVDQRGL
jgi:hypothetical protein